MTTVDELLQAARTPGEVIERRSFRLAPDHVDRARRNLVLPRRGQFASELVMAAHFARADLIAVSAIPGGLSLAWLGGAAVDPEALQDLFALLFIDASTPALRTLRGLAIAANGALHDGARQIQLTVGDGTSGGGRQLTINADGRATLARTSKGVHGAVLVVQQAASLWARLTRSGHPALRELHQRCAYTSLPLMIDGHLPFGEARDAPIPLFGVAGETRIAAPGLRGTLGLGAPGAVRIAVGGVWVTTRSLPELHPRLTGVVCDDRLRRTADLGDVVEDDAYAQMIDAIAETASAAIAAAESSGASARRRTMSPRPAPRDRRRPLPDPLPLLPPRRSLPTSRLPAALAAGPVFLVETQRADLLRDPCDPLIFPYPVVVLAGLASADLQRQHPALIPLATSVDVAAARARFGRPLGEQRASWSSRAVTEAAGLDATQPVEITVAWTPGRPADSPIGPLPAGSVPLFLVAEGRCIQCRPLECDLPDVAVLLTLPTRPQATLDTGPLVRAIQTAIRRAGWRAILDRTSPDRDPVAVAALALAMRVSFERTIDGRTVPVVGLAQRVPIPDPGQDPWLDLPLTRGSADPLTLRRWVAALRADPQAAASDPADPNDPRNSDHLAPIARALRPPDAGAVTRDPSLAPPGSWLAVIRVDELGVRGWLALPTTEIGPPVVRLDGDDGRVDRPDLASALGCWGEIQLDRGRAPTPAQRAALRRATTMLYAHLFHLDDDALTDRPTLRSLVAAFSERPGLRDGALARQLRERFALSPAPPPPPGPTAMDPRLALLDPLREALTVILGAEARIVPTHQSPPPAAPTIVHAVLSPPRLSIALPEGPPWLAPGRASPAERARARLQLASAIATWLHAVRPGIDPTPLTTAALISYLEG